MGRNAGVRLRGLTDELEPSAIMGRVPSPATRNCTQSDSGGRSTQKACKWGVLKQRPTRRDTSPASELGRESATEDREDRCSFYLSVAFVPAKDLTRG